MNLKFILSVVLSALLIPGAAFAEDQNNNKDNPYGFEMVQEANKTFTVIEPGEIEDPDIDMKDINENDTYQAQKNADAAAIKKLEREAAQVSKKMKPAERGAEIETAPLPKDPPTRQPANKVSKKFHELMKNPKVVKFLDFVGYCWKKFKGWFVTLPGIRHWLASPYTMDNYKKELGKVDYVEKKEKKNQLKKDSSSAKKLKEGSKEFFK